MKKTVVVLLLILLFTGFRYTKNEPNKLELSRSDEKEIEEYINTLNNPGMGGEMNSAFELLGKNDEKGELYLWIASQEYFRKDEDQPLESTSGVSMPLLLKVIKEEALVIKGHKAPREGIFYNKDVKRMFPKDVREKMSIYDSENLFKELDERAAEEQIE